MGYNDKFLSVFFAFIMVFCMNSWAEESQEFRVGLLVVATGKYIQWVQPLIDSADEFFLKNQKVTYFIFTDDQDHLNDNIQIQSNRSVRLCYHQRLGWPYDTMMRQKAYYTYKKYMKNMDYLFAVDADMLFVDFVGDEVLSERVATQHPGFVKKRGTYENRKISSAYVAPYEGTCYFAGGFNGGSRKEYLKLCKTVNHNIEKDLENDCIAIWHDESHINRYFIDNPPTVILSPSYCYPESWKLPYRKRLLALDKNHSEVRSS